MDLLSFLARQQLSLSTSLYARKSTNLPCLNVRQHIFFQNATTYSQNYVIIKFCQKLAVLAFQFAGHCFPGHNFGVLFLTLLTIHVGLVTSGTSTPSTSSTMQEIINNNAICNMSLGIMRQQKKTRLTVWEEGAVLLFVRFSRNTNV